MTMKETTDTFIELHIPDFQKAIDFYKILGFKVVWVSEEYLVMRKNKSVLFFYGGDKKIFEHPYFNKFQKNTKRGYGVEIVLFEKNIKDFYNKIKDKVNVVEPLQLRPWGKLDFRIEDPFGFYIRIGEPDIIIDYKEGILKTKDVAKRKGLIL